MGVHASSVIPTWLNTWRSDFYTSITDKEESAYNQVNGVMYWQPLFTNLATALDNYHTYDRGSELVDFIPVLYGYQLFHVMYGTSSGLLSDARQLYALNGFITTTLGRGVNYYDDIDFDPLPATSVKLAADIAIVAAAATAETSTVNSVKMSCVGVVKYKAFDLLFTNPTILATKDKVGMADLIFNTLKFKEVFQNLNVGTLTLPPGV